MCVYIFWIYVYILDVKIKNIFISTYNIYVFIYILDIKNPNYIYIYK